MMLLLVGLGVHFIREAAQDAGVWAGGDDGQAGARRAWTSSRVIERDDRHLLWALGDPQSAGAEWFDVTDSEIDPERFQHGIGKDTIPAIDEPVFADADDPQLRERGITDRTVVIGSAYNDEAKAYPLHILDRHELVNDRIGGKPVTVGW
jgi:hypothetical protein